MARINKHAKQSPYSSSCYQEFLSQKFWSHNSQMSKSKTKKKRTNDTCRKSPGSSCITKTVQQPWSPKMLLSAHRTICATINLPRGIPRHPSLKREALGLGRNYIFFPAQVRWKKKCKIHSLTLHVFSTLDQTMPPWKRSCSPISPTKTISHLLKHSAKNKNKQTYTKLNSTEKCSKNK